MYTHIHMYVCMYTDTYVYIDICIAVNKRNAALQDAQQSLEGYQGHKEELSRR
jgi:hypothetical protein